MEDCSPSDNDNPTQSHIEDEARTDLTQTQKERAERNRQKALALRRSRIHHQTVDYSSESKQPKLSTKDSYGGFFFEDEDEVAQVKEKRLVHDEGPAVGDELMECEECLQKFAESFLWSHFKCSVCNECRDSDEKHKLITKTEAKERFLLKDCDFEDRGGPPLLFILKRNPHTSRGDMKLYLVSQVVLRSHQLWDGEDGLEREKRKRTEAKEKRKQKLYSKQVKELRKTVYSNSHSTSRSHTHVYNLERYDSETDTWIKTCEECGHTVSFEKM